MAKTNNLIYFKIPSFLPYLFGNVFHGRERLCFRDDECFHGIRHISFQISLVIIY